MIVYPIDDLIRAEREVVKGDRASRRRIDRGTLGVSHIGSQSDRAGRRGLSGRGIARQARPSKAASSVGRRKSPFMKIPTSR